MTPPDAVVLDTDVVSYLALERDPARAQSFRSMTVGVRLVAISFATYGELLAVGHGAGWGEARLAQLRLKLRRFVVLPFSLTVAEMWAVLHPKLSGHLHRGGANDLWTAACALAQSPPLPVMTNNLRDFDAIARQRSDLVVLHPTRVSDSA